jgi:hypothetical protein
MVDQHDEVAIKQSRLLVVEGVDELNFFQSLIRHTGISGIQVLPIGGKAKLQDKLKLLKSSPNFEAVMTIGVVRDSDNDPESAFKSVRSALRNAGLSVPKRVLTFSDGDPRIMVMVMPPNKEGTNHMLEDLCLEAVKDDPAMRCVDQYIECLKEQNITHTDNRTAKARLHAFLASQREPDLRLGEAAQAGYWPWDQPTFDPVKGFLRQLAQ